MKKETIYLLLFWGVMAVAIFYVIKLIRQMNDAITVSKS